MNTFLATLSKQRGILIRQHRSLWNIRWWEEEVWEGEMTHTWKGWNGIEQGRIQAKPAEFSSSCVPSTNNVNWYMTADIIPVFPTQVPTWTARMSVQESDTSHTNIQDKLLSTCHRLAIWWKRLEEHTEKSIHIFSSARGRHLVQAELLLPTSIYSISRQSREGERSRGRNNMYTENHLFLTNLGESRSQTESWSLEGLVWMHSRSKDSRADKFWQKSSIYLPPDHSDQRLLPR